MFAWRHRVFDALLRLCLVRYSSHAEDYLTDMMGCFENFMVRGTAEFLRIPDYCDALVAIARRLVNERSQSSICVLMASFVCNQTPLRAKRIWRPGRVAQRR